METIMVKPELTLWKRIRDFSLDDPQASLPFSARLARENGWSRSFARRVLEEYKRFLFLAMVAGHEVTPSDEVDQAWHLHLVYTHSYWNSLCGEILGKSLHHGPTRGGTAEGQRYDLAYGSTLESYEKWFGERPPVDIWPPPSIRFANTSTFRRVNTARNWIVSKRLMQRSAVAVGIAVVALAGIGAAAPAMVADQDILMSGGFWFFAVLGVIIAMGAVSRFTSRKSNRRGDNSSSGCGSGLFGCGSGGKCDGDSGCGASGCSGSSCGDGGCGGGGCGGGD
jgi:hypothetical protein